MSICIRLLCWSSIADANCRSEYCDIPLGFVPLHIDSPPHHGELGSHYETASPPWDTLILLFLIVIEADWDMLKVTCS